MADAKTIGFNFSPREDYRGDWRKYFDEYTTQLAEFKAEDPSLEEPPVAILAPGHEVDPTTLPRAAKALWTKLEAAGWTLRAQSSETFQEGKTYGPNAQKAGEKMRDRYCVHTWIAGRLRDSQFMAYWLTDDGKTTFQDCLTGDRIFSKVGDMNDWLLERSLDNDEGTEDR